MKRKEIKGSVKWQWISHSRYKSRGNLLNHPGFGNSAAQGRGNGKGVWKSLN